MRSAALKHKRQASLNGILFPLLRDILAFFHWSLVLFRSKKSASQQRFLSKRLDTFIAQNLHNPYRGVQF